MNPNDLQGALRRRRSERYPDNTALAPKKTRISSMNARKYASSVDVFMFMKTN